MPFSIVASESLPSGRGVLANLEHNMSDWSRSTQFEGGAWRGTFRLDGPKGMLENWFYNGLARHIEEWSWGMNTWTGLVWEIDFVQPSRTSWFFPFWPYRSPRPGRRMRRTLEDVFNAVKVFYTDPSTDPPTTNETSWYNDTVSQFWLGTKQEILYEYMSAASAAARAQEFLDRAATAVPVVMGVEQEVVDPYLEIVVAGYVATGQYEFVTSDNGNQDDVSDWVDAILGGDMGDFLQKGMVDPNTTQVYRYLPNKRRGWEVLEDLVTLRDTSDNRFRLIVDNDQHVHYKIWDREPIGYFWGGRFVNRSYSDLEKNPRLMQPGVYRTLGFGDPTYLPYLSSGEGLLLSPYDMLVESIEVNQDDSFNVRLGIYDDEEALRSFVFKKEDLPGYEEPDEPEGPSHPPFDNPYWPPSDNPGYPG